MRYCIEGWEDGLPVQSWLDSPDRWQTQAAERVILELGPGITITLQQQPRALTAARLGVGACLWDGAFVLASYLAAQPPGTFFGKRCVELGAGVGAAGLALAALGARVTLTDKPALLPLLRGNIARNWLGAGSPARPAGSEPRGHADAAALEWGAEGYLQDAERLTQGAPVDLVVACDCVYPDPDGPSPDPGDFVAALAALCACHRPPAAAPPCGSGVTAPVPPARHDLGCGGGAASSHCLASQDAVDSDMPAAVGGAAIAAAGRAGAGEHDGARGGAATATAASAARGPCEEARCGGGACVVGAPAPARALVTFEVRSDQMRAAFLDAARARFGRVRRVAATELPAPYRVDHVELYELSL